MSINFKISFEMDVDSEDEIYYNFERNQQEIENLKRGRKIQGRTKAKI